MKRYVWTTSAAVLALGALLAGPSLRSGDDDDEGNAEVRRGLAIAPVPLDMKGKNRDLVGLGSYIVNAQAGCVDCHSCPTFAAGHNPYRGQTKKLNDENYLAGGVPFGPFTSRNITPDAHGKLELTLAQFKEVMHKGTDFDHQHPQFGPLLQVMPWPLFQDMTDHDIRAIYEYLRSIPHAEHGTCGGAGDTAP